MKIDVEKFVKLPSIFLFMFPPCDNDCSNNSCLLTCKDYNEINNAVCTDDGRIYDAHALKQWLSTQPYEKYVIPGVFIHTINIYTWQNFRLYVDFYKKTLMFINIAMAYLKIFIKYMYIICTMVTAIQDTQIESRNVIETSNSEIQTDILEYGHDTCQEYVNDTCQEYIRNSCQYVTYDDIDELTFRFRKMKIKKKIIIPSPDSAFTPYTHIFF